MSYENSDQKDKLRKKLTNNFDVLTIGEQHGRVSVSQTVQIEARGL
jgi:hypothetical protein